LRCDGRYLWKYQKLTTFVTACGPTHTAITPLDLVKTRRQVDPTLYKSNVQAWSSIFKNEGVRGVFFGWAPTLVGYSLQGAGKYGLYEVFKYYYGETFPNANKTVVFLGASATAEFFADIALCPFEAIKVRMQTTLPPFANNLRQGWSKIVAKEGYAGLYKGLYPLWARQIPYTMVSHPFILTQRFILKAWTVQVCDFREDC
jgi:solute carrier family 25 phosphate transporter 3